MADKIEYPINGWFTSKRGIDWQYTIYEDHTGYMFRPTVERKVGGYRQGNGIYSDFTQECKKIIKEKYGIDVR